MRMAGIVDARDLVGDEPPDERVDGHSVFNDSRRKVLLSHFDGPLGAVEEAGEENQPARKITERAFHRGHSVERLALVFAEVDARRLEGGKHVVDWNDTIGQDRRQGVEDLGVRTRHSRSLTTAEPLPNPKSRLRTKSAQVSRAGDFQCSVDRFADRSAVFVEVPVALSGPGSALLLLLWLMPERISSTIERSPNDRRLGVNLG